MFCPKCGKINPDENKECSGCGAVLKEENEVPAAKKKGKALKIIVTALIVIAVICIVLLLLNGCGSVLPPEEKMTF